MIPGKQAQRNGNDDIVSVMCVLAFQIIVRYRGYRLCSLPTEIHPIVERLCREEETLLKRLSGCLCIDK